MTTSVRGGPCVSTGIEACIPEELNPQIFWNFIPSVLEAVTVRVTARDYDAAKELLGQINSEEQPDEQRVQAAAAPRSPGQPPPLPQP